MIKVISHSEREIFKRCRLKWHFSYREKLVPKVPPRQLFLGRAVHAGLAKYYYAEMLKQSGKNSPIGGTIGDLTAGFMEDIMEQQTFLDNYFEMSVEDQEEYQKLVELGKTMLEGYYEFAKANDGFRILNVERKFKLRLPTPITTDPTAFYTTPYTTKGGSSQTFVSGRTDLEVEDEDGIWVIDHKTTQTLETKGLELDEQQQTYAWAKERENHKPVKGVIYNMLRKSVPKEPIVLKNGQLSVAKIDTTTEKYRQAIVKLGLDEKKYETILWGLELNKFFHRERIYHNQKELENAALALYYESKDMFKPAIYRNWTRDCSWDCSYRTLCVQSYDGSDVSYLKEAGFDRKRV